MVEAYQCDRCGYIWFPRKRVEDEEEPELPKTCPHCKSPYWNTPRKNKRPAGSGEAASGATQ